MTAGALLQDIQSRGIQVTLSGEQLSYDAPRGAMTDELLSEIRAHKAALVALLQPAETPPEPLSSGYPCVSCGGGTRWDDTGIWRCVVCWPEPLTMAARRHALG